MQKKLLVICLALVALAAVPSAASAALYSGSTKLPVGSEVRGVSVGGVFFESVSSAINCTSSQWGASLLKNNEGTAQLQTQSWSFQGQGKGGSCTSPMGNVTVVGHAHSCWEAKKSAWYLSGGGTCLRGTPEFTITSEWATCKYNFAETSIYSSTQSPVQLSGAYPRLVLTESPSAFCASEYLLKTTWAIKDAAGNPVNWI